MPLATKPGWSDLGVDDPLYERDEEEGTERGQDTGEEGEQKEGGSEALDPSTTPPSPSQLGSWTLEQYASPNGQRPGPQPLIGRRRNLSSQQTNSAANNSSGSLSESSRVPAAGVGTRVGPRPVPKSSSSLRHISSKARTSSFGVPLYENRDPSMRLSASGDYRTVQSSLDAAKRRQGKEREQEDFLVDDSDEDDDPRSRSAYSGEATGWESDLYGSLGKRRATTSSGHEVDNPRPDGFGYERSSGEEEEGEEEGLAEGPPTLFQVSSHDEDEPDKTSSWAEKARAARYGAAEPGGPSLRGPRRAAWHPRGPSVNEGGSPPLLGSSSGLTTPGPVFPHPTHTPQGTPDEEPLQTIEPRQRLEWHTMLQSVLRSEVLQSETKRITSADAPLMTRRELMHQRWLDIRASLRGRGHYPGAVEMEEKRLREGWPILLHQVMDAVRQCRTSATTVEERGAGAEIDESSIAIDDVSGTKEKALDEVGHVLQQVDDAEEQFPSFRKLAEEMPSWNEEEMQRKLDGLYSWHNVASSLRLQLRILQQWTGSKTLDIAGHQGVNRMNPNSEVNGPSQGVDGPPGSGAVVHQGEMEESTFLERILKEDSLQSTFEKRTLRALNQITLKAKMAIVEHHEAFSEMSLPSFEPELSQLINFPTRVMEGALKLRLDYAGKIKEPSVLIIDSLTDDLRAAIALACRIKLQYSTIMVPDPANGWDLLPCIGKGYDPVLREALQFFFELLNYKVKGSTFFKETEVLEPEWRFLSTAVEAIEGGDVIVAISITRFVNKLFKRIVAYFERELSAPSTSRTRENDFVNPRTGVSGANKEMLIRGPSTAGALTQGHVKMTLDEKVRWIHQVFNSVRIRSRKLLGFARDIRNRLENAAEYDLSSLSSVEEVEGEEGAGMEDCETGKSDSMHLTQFLQTLIDAGYFLVMTDSFEAEGVYLIAEPSLSNKPELIQELFCKCLRQVKPSEEESAMAAKESALNKSAIGVEMEGKEEERSEGGTEGGGGAAGGGLDRDDEGPKYLLLLSPRDAFLWTGRIMSLELPRFDVDLKERRLRLIADGPNRRLHLCQTHLYSVFNAAAARPREEEEDPDQNSTSRKPPSKSAATAAPAARAKDDAQQTRLFPLEVLTERLAHVSAVQSELRRINQGVYMLSDAIIRAVPKIRRNLRGRRMQQSNDRLAPSPSNEDRRRGVGTSGDSDELIQNCFSMASEQGYRALPFIESARLRGQMTLALATLAIDWVAFICDDCEPSDRKTFKWAVAALENAQHVTRAGGILNIGEDDFILMRSKVASCVGLLISHFDILGARSSVAKAKEEEERLEREKAERLKAVENAASGEYSQAAAKAIQGSGTAGAPPMLGRADSGMQATEERWVGKVMEWDAARQSIESEQRLIGRVLDDTRLEDRGLQFLASSSSRIQIRWQQGRFIGGGTFGTVYLAVNLDSGGLMAVKEIRFQDISSTPGMYKQIKDEMSVMEMLSHPNIVEYYGIEVHRDKVYIFEEYCQGGSLAQLLEHGRIEDEAVTQVYTLQMLDGLVYLHSKGVVHRDIKPDNILLDHMGVIKFVDFGAAKVLAKNSRTIQRSKRTGNAAGVGGAMAGMLGPDGKPKGAAAASLQGTPMYMSPEVIKGESRGRRGAMDVWSLGCVVLEFATGRRPWSQLDNEWAIMFHIGMAQQHPPLPEPGQLSDLGIEFIRSCLIIDPYDRPSAIELREHPWIQNLIEELNRANEDEGLQDAMNQTPGSSDAMSSYVHGTDSAAGVAAMAATPGTRSINGFNFGRPSTASSFGATSSFTRHSTDSLAGFSSNLTTPNTATTSSSKPIVGREEGGGGVADEPVQPAHQHAGQVGPDAESVDEWDRQGERQTEATQQSLTQDSRNPP